LSEPKPTRCGETTFTADFYALAALACAAIVSAGHVLHFHPVAPAVAGMLVCFALRFMAIRHGWHLPSAQLAPDADTPAHDSDKRGSKKGP